MIKGLNEEPRKVAHGTSMMIGSYMLVFRNHAAQSSIQMLLMKGRDRISETWIEPEDLMRVIKPVIKTL